MTPLPLETALIENCPLLSHAIVIGDERKYLVCLITLKSKLDNGRPT